MMRIRPRKARSKRYLFDLDMTRLYFKSNTRFKRNILDLYSDDLAAVVDTSIVDTHVLFNRHVKEGY